MTGQLVGEHAVVLGGGMAGLLAGRVLADRYRSVTMVERDHVAGERAPRRGVPQGHHAHGLLARGQQILEELFPGLLRELTERDALTGDLAGAHRWYFNGERLTQPHSGLLAVAAARPVLESHIRARVLALPGVRLLQGTVIQGLTTNPDRDRVTGVRIAEEGSDEARVLPADLVVDATGRGSRTPAWLEELGYQRPVEERIKIDLAYTSRLFRLDSDPFGTDIAINSVASPANPRGAFFGKLVGGVVLLSLTGLLGDHPPRDPDGFLDFARTLAAPEIYPAVRTAEPLTDIASFRFPASVRRRYDQLDRFPDGLLLIGDGICSFNPVYGQGMTVAAMEAVALGAHLDAGPPRPLGFFREITPIIDVPWGISAGGDLAFPQVAGPRPFKVRMSNAYINRLHTAARVDGRFTSAFFRVAGLVDPPQALMRPGLAVDVLRTARRVRRLPADRPVQPHPDSREGVVA